MSDIDTIRRYIENSALYRFPPASASESQAGRQAASDALAALVAEIQQQADRIAWLEGDVAQRRIENQRLRDALRYITGRDVAGYEPHMRPEEVARAALVGTS